MIHTNPHFGADIVQNSLVFTPIIRTDSHQETYPKTLIEGISNSIFCMKYARLLAFESFVENKSLTLEDKKIRFGTHFAQNFFHDEFKLNFFCCLSPSDMKETFAVFYTTEWYRSFIDKFTIDKPALIFDMAPNIFKKDVVRVFAPKLHSSNIESTENLLVNPDSNHELKEELQNWQHKTKNNNGAILLLANKQAGSDKYVKSGGKSIAKWISETVFFLIHNSKRKIIIKAHPSDSEDKTLQASIRFLEIKFPERVSIFKQKDIFKIKNQIYAAVTDQSYSAFMFVSKGIPLFVTSNESCMRPFSSGLLEDLERPNLNLDQRKNMQELKNSIWNIEDIENGKIIDQFIYQILLKKDLSLLGSLVPKEIKKIIHERLCIKK